jgi:phosphohistidine swiveling domain-containing protein
VHKPAFLSLADCYSISEKTLGKPIKQVVQLHQKGFSVAPSIVLTPTDLQYLFHNQIETKKRILETYHRRFKSDFVKLVYTYKKEIVQIDNIKGDANLIQTIQKIAPHIAAHNYLLVQASPQPTFSGVAYTRNQTTGDKRQIDIEFMQGVFNEADTTNHQHITIDIRTANIVQKKLSQQQAWKKALDGLTNTTFDSNKQELPPIVVTKLTKLTTAIKRHFFADQKIDWYVYGKQLFISSIEPQKVFFEQTTHGSLLSLGITLIPGFVQGRPFFLSSTKQMRTGSILVAEKLTNDHVPHIKQSNGIIVEQTITDQKVLQLLTKFHIPSIVHTQFARRNIAPNQEIILDASAGKVFSSHESVVARRPQDSLQLSILGGDPRLLTDQTLARADGYLLSSNSFIAAQQTHPLALDSKKQKLFISQLVSAATFTQKSFKNWKYMLFSMSSELRKQLAKSAPFEIKNEINPSLGNRGLAYILEHQHLLAMELEALSYISRQTDSTPQLVLPFCKTATDVLFAQKILETKTTYTHILCPHIVTFSGLEDIARHRQAIRLAESLLDIDYLAASWLGIDPQIGFPVGQIIESAGFWHQLESFTQKMSHQPQLLVRNVSPKLVHKLRKMEYNNLVTTPHHLAAARMA